MMINFREEGLHMAFVMQSVCVMYSSINSSKRTEKKIVTNVQVDVHQSNNMKFVRLCRQHTGVNIHFHVYTW